MSSILIITRGQFGTLIDTYQYCKYLSGKYKISYICFDEQVPKMCLPDIDIHYISYKGSRTLRGIRFILSVISYALFHKGMIFMVYFSQCEWVRRILFWKKIHLDIRTLSVLPHEADRKREDAAIIRSCRSFQSISVISREVGERLHLSDKSACILPLGADPISTVTNREYTKMRLLYVGVLFNRNIIDTVTGVHQFMKAHPNATVSYDIVGDGPELSALRQYVEENHLEPFIKIHGRVSYDELQPFFDKCNIGVSYVPLYDYYQHQPVTKTFEYIMSGLYCIATRTVENSRVVSAENGILIEDNSPAFAKALEYVSEQRDAIDSAVIRNTLTGYQWKNIIDGSLLPIINSLQTN